MISASAVLIDHQGRVLLTEDPTSGTLIPPTVALEPGVLPSDTLAQTVRDVTGIIALPLRLTGIYAGESGLNLSFRTIQRGGAIREENGQLVAGFFPATPTPQPTLPAGRQQIEDALHHSGGEPVCAPAATTLSGRLRRAFGLSGTTPTNPQWDIRANLIIQTGNGTVWLPQAEQERYHLPSISVASGELPCIKAAELAATLPGSNNKPRLSGVYLHTTQPIIEFAFTLQMSGALPGNARLFSSGNEPEECLPTHVQQVADAVPSNEAVIFGLMPEASRE